MANKLVKKERNKNKDADMMKAGSFGKRCFAFVVDWYVGAAIASMPAIFLWEKLTGEVSPNTDLILFESPYGYIAGLLGIVFALAYYYIVPLAAWKGQTLGKRLMKLQIVDVDGSSISAGNLFLRQFVGIMILEAAFLMTGNMFSQMITMATTEMVGTVIGWIQIAAFIISVLLVWRKGYAIHDLLGRSSVIEYKN